MNIQHEEEAKLEDFKTHFMLLFEIEVINDTGESKDAEDLKQPEGAEEFGILDAGAECVNAVEGDSSQNIEPEATQAVVTEYLLGRGNLLTSLRRDIASSEIEDNIDEEDDINS